MVATSRPSQRTCPLVGCSRAAPSCSIVVLPEPERPDTTTSSAAPTLRLNSGSAVAGGSSPIPGYVLLTATNSSTASGVGTVKTGALLCCSGLC